MRKIERPETLKRFGERFKKFRQAADVSQEQVHYATGIAQPHLSEIETGSRNIGLTHIAVLAEFFGLTDSELLDYSAPLPSSEELKKSIRGFLKKNGIDPATFLKKGLANTLRTKVLPSKFLSSPRFAKEVADLLKDKFGADFTTTAISQALENLRKKGLVVKLPTDKKSKFQYRKSDKN
ncbi:MAG TPA: helix-turn-helix transcriptional regulator [Ohtaekwangia sp.]|uniref:helix-turn-helix domain-containing protein n=1 Tax=Ohtaekwangia sp. TaxID=2066019 RepID=UPI002F91F44F